MVSVWDLRDYNFCKRKLWLSRKARIEGGERDWDSPAKLHVLNVIFNRVNSKARVQSRTTFMLEAINVAPGQIVGTEVPLRRGELSGRIDVLRKTEDGFIVQEEKTSDPPNEGGVWPSDQIQLDAYAFLAENSKYSPVKKGVIIYSDLVPREVRLNPKRVEGLLEEVLKFLENDCLPIVETNVNKCVKCSYYPLCQVLPTEGGLTRSELKSTLRHQISPQVSTR
jgi:CRISPR-associated protein Cas4